MMLGVLYFCSIHGALISLEENATFLMFVSSSKNASDGFQM